MRALGLLMSFALYGDLAYQLRKPSRWLGMPFLVYMNLSHSALTDWGIRQVDLKPDFTVLDVGCGIKQRLEPASPRLAAHYDLAPFESGTPRSASTCP